MNRLRRSCEASWSASKRRTDSAGYFQIDPKSAAGWMLEKSSISGRPALEELRLATQHDVTPLDFWAVVEKILRAIEVDRSVEAAQ